MRLDDSSSDCKAHSYSVTPGAEESVKHSFFVFDGNAAPGVMDSDFNKVIRRP